ncbi:MAG: alpha/beta fold hydrolase, partial [Bdellovibrionales bacterium]|nr:alpha/beta fold hydrolase [Bdellovibrionales bacterium]
MTERFESRFKGFDKKELFFQCWLTPQADRTMVITHGLAEHSECYHDFALKMNEDKINVYAWDLAGHGRSSGKRGYIPNFNDYELDLRCFIDVIFKEIGSDDKKIILFGHSMGGLITLMHLLSAETSRYAAACLSSPALGYSIEVSSIKDWLARFSNKWLPTLTLYNEIEYRDLTHLPEKLAEYENDSFRHDKVCAAIYLGMMENFDFVFKNAETI